MASCVASTTSSLLWASTPRSGSFYFPQAQTAPSMLPLPYRHHSSFTSRASFTARWTHQPWRHEIRRNLCVCAKPSLEEIEEEKEMVEMDAMERMEKTLESVKSNFNTIRTGRASPALLDRIEVEYYGAPVILKSVAQISVSDGSTLLVQPFEKSTLPLIEKAIQQSDLGLNPSNDGSVIRLSIPQLTADRRKELVKTIAKLAEEGKVAVRNVRRDAIKAYEKMEKDDKMSEDSVRGATEEIQKLTDEYVKKVDAILKAKEKEITTV